MMCWGSASAVCLWLMQSFRTVNSACRSKCSVRPVSTETSLLKKYFINALVMMITRSSAPHNVNERITRIHASQRWSQMLSLSKGRDCPACVKILHKLQKQLQYRIRNVCVDFAQEVMCNFTDYEFCVWFLFDSHTENNNCHWYGMPLLK